jgi:hypothetical protein
MFERAVAMRKAPGPVSGLFARRSEGAAERRLHFARLIGPSLWILQIGSGCAGA